MTIFAGAMTVLAGGPALIAAATSGGSALVLLAVAALAGFATGAAMRAWRNARRRK